MSNQANSAEWIQTPVVHPGIARRLTQMLVGGLIVISFLLFWYGGELLGIPFQFKCAGSLLQQGTFGRSLAALIGSAVLLVLCALLADSFLRRRWFLSGLAVACAGFMAWSIRGGPMHQVIFYATSKSVFMRLAFETLLLGGMVAAIWNFFWSRMPAAASGSLPVSPPPAKPGKSAAKSEEQPSLLMALVAQAVTMAATLLILLNQTDAKKQVLATVFIAGLAGTCIAESYFADRKTARWYWLGPVVVGVVGYLIAFFTFPNWDSGNRMLDTMSFAALVRPLPLDYVSAGLFGALTGYWLTQKGPETSD